jgi:superfamily II DNA helicase RecQ
MKLKFFTIPAVSPEAAEADLNRFLGAHRVSHVERHFTADGAASFWAICVTWVEAGEGPGASLAPDGARRGRIDYREVLEADEFALYDRLRTLRKQTAEAEGLPPFAVFTNEQLADMVRRRAATLADLGRIEGIGEARLGRFGATFLEVLREGVPRLGPPAAAPTPVPTPAPTPAAPT